MNFMKREKYVAPMIHILMTEELCSGIDTGSVHNYDKPVDKFGAKENQSDEWFDDTDNWGGC